MGGGGGNPRDSKNSQNLKNTNIPIDTRIPNISPHLIDYRMNPKAFINAHNFATLDDLVQEVKRIDNDKEAYEAMCNEPIFLDGFNPHEYYDKKILAFFDSIFSQNPKEALRRGSGQHASAYENMLKKIYQYRDVCYYPRNLIRSLRHKMKK